MNHRPAAATNPAKPIIPSSDIVGTAVVVVATHVIVVVRVFVLTLVEPETTSNGVPPLSRSPIIIVSGPIANSVWFVITTRSEPTGLHAGGDSVVLLLEVDLVKVVGGASWADTPTLHPTLTISSSSLAAIE